MISVQNFRKAYRTVQAVADVSFDVPNGLITGLLGPNGAGKTTTLRGIAGLISPDGGTATIDGIDITRDAARARRAVGILPDSPGCYGRLTVREHVAYSGALQGLGRREISNRVEALLDMLDLTALGSRLAGQLSTGESRRMRLACCLVHDPANVILDEPTNGLDVMSTRLLRAEVRRLAGQGRAVLFSSHVMPEVAATCDRVVVFSKGRVAAEGTPAELQARTGQATLEDAFVAIVGSTEGLQ
jgi:sodium transport system ATP-binding protein